GFGRIVKVVRVTGGRSSGSPEDWHELVRPALAGEVQFPVSDIVGVCDGLKRKGSHLTAARKLDDHPTFGVPFRWLPLVCNADRLIPCPGSPSKSLRPRA